MPKNIGKVILDHIKHHHHFNIHSEQAGFRAGSSCVDYTNMLRIIIEQNAAYRSDLHLAFVDFEKAFDSVNREEI